MLSEMEVFKRTHIFIECVIIVTFIAIQDIALEGAWFQPS
jgi:hypothetical protein